jgi:hypothetical protein
VQQQCLLPAGAPELEYLQTSSLQVVISTNQKLVKSTPALGDDVYRA